MPRSTLIKIAVPLVGLLFGLVAVAVVVGLFRAWWTSPFDVFGIAAAPTQPLDFPHQVHVEQVGIQCEFCHRNVSIGEAATVPAVEQCLFCHKDLPNGQFLGQGIPAVDQLRLAWENNEPIDWERVHRLPDHVQFVHEPHIRFFSQQGQTTQQTCAICHGDVGAMAQVEQVKDLKMSDCVDCHRQNNAPTDCVICHY